MKRKKYLPELYLRYLLEADAEEGQLKPPQVIRPEVASALWQHSCSARKDKIQMHHQHSSLAVDDFDLSCFLPELGVAERFQLLTELLAASDDIRLDLLGLKQVAASRLRVSLCGMKYRGPHPHDEYSELLAVFVHSDFLTFVRDEALLRAFTSQVCNSAFGVQNVFEGAPYRLHGHIVFTGIPLAPGLSGCGELHLWDGGCR